MLTKPYPFPVFALAIAHLEDERCRARQPDPKAAMSPPQPKLARRRRLALRHRKPRYRMAPSSCDPGLWLDNGTYPQRVSARGFVQAAQYVVSCKPAGCSMLIPRLCIRGNEIQRRRHSPIKRRAPTRLRPEWFVCRQIGALSGPVCATVFFLRQQYAKSSMPDRGWLPALRLLLVRGTLATGDGSWLRRVWAPILFDKLLTNFLHQPVGDNRAIC